MREPLPSSGLTDMSRPDCSVGSVVPIWKLASKCDGSGLPGRAQRPGENVWSPKEPLVIASDTRSACAPNAVTGSSREARDARHGHVVRAGLHPARPGR